MAMCELRFDWKTELDDHCWHDHPEFRHDDPAQPAPQAPTRIDVDPSRDSRASDTEHRQGDRLQAGGPQYAAPLPPVRSAPSHAARAEPYGESCRHPTPNAT